MSKDSLVKGLIFVAGAAIGSLVTWKVVKTKYEQIAQEEIESVREAFGRNIDEDDTEESTEDESGIKGVDLDSPSVAEEIRGIVKKLGYVTELPEEENPTETTEEKEENKEEEEEEDMDSKPYVISPDEFGDCEYITVSLSYYLDGIVTNEQGKIVTNTDELIGEDFADHFGEYEDDSVFVRNDRLGMDFEILKDYRDYYEDEE